MKQIRLEVTAPFFSAILRDISPKPVKFTFSNVEFFFHGTVLATKNQMLLEICWNLDDYEHNHINRYVEKGIEALNHLIYCARTFDYQSLEIVLLSPRSVKEVEVFITEPGVEDQKINHQLHYEAPKYFTDYYSYLNDDGFYPDISEFEELAANQALEINLLVDANHAIFEGRYSESIIHCLTAIETHMFPLLSEWLKGSFLNQSMKNAENVLIDMPSSAKLELLFGTVRAEYLSHHPNLLEELKGINKLRNNIVHQGKRASRKEAVSALNSTAKFVIISYLQVGKDDWDWNERNDLTTSVN